jgi:tetratricopeptide (TPR) repeat protein
MNQSKKQFKLLNSIFGWVSFVIAAITYLLTMEPTASFWDCGEFISTAFKLEVGHPPGAPLFMIMGRLFTLLAGGNVQHAAIWMNSMSALASGFTILFLFWSITHLARKILIKNDEYSLSKTIIIIGAGLVGALAYAFSDTFWFSAVEAEVYASSSLFTAIVFWAVLKWEDRADQKHADRWLVLIAYLMGLSIGIHLLNLLVIPAIVFVYYFRKYKVDVKGIIYASLISIVLLALVLYGVIQGLIVIASKFELLFVNNFGLPYGYGVIFYLLLLTGLIIWGLSYTHKKGKVVFHTAITMLTVIIIGYSSVAMIVIRSSVDPPLDENDPENMFSLLSYLNREQYGDRPLFYGPTYNAPVIGVEENGKPTYTPINGKYEITNRKVEYKYDERFMMFFPRMYSSDPDHVKAYQYWGKVKGTPIQVQNNKGENTTVYKPTFGENLKFFWNYQIVHMYFRYFMWNFSGRQNDMQGFGEPNKGNWITGIKFLDEARLGPQDNQPDSMTKNKGRNCYYLLPFLLGLIGLIYHYKKSKKDFTVVMLLFFFTGLAIVLYLNQTPYQPRERDYAYAGSFYAYAIWIGLGVLQLIEWLNKVIKSNIANILVILLCLIFVPGVMAKENWDDHDRSKRYTCRDFAANYLNSCEQNGIIFTNGDNDTFPLWYAQEVEGIRTDVRVVNLSYLSADWYLDQMHRKAYKSDPLPFTFTRDQVLQGKRDIVYLIDRIKEPVDLKQALEFVASDDPQTKTLPNYTERIDYIPAKTFKLDIDTATVFANNYLAPNEKSKVVSQMQWTINQNYVTKAGMLVLDLIAHNNWKRPVYFAVTVSHDNYLNLDNYMQINGMTYKVLPIKQDAPMGDIQNINVDTTYNNMMNKFRWGGINNSKVYLDENNLRMLSNLRNMFAKLADALISENKLDSALKVANKAMEVMPDNCVPYNYFVIPFVDIYYRLNQSETAQAISKRLFDIATSELRYVFQFRQDKQNLMDYDIRINLRMLQQLFLIEKQYGNIERASQIEKEFQNYYNRYVSN